MKTNIIDQILLVAEQLEYEVQTIGNERLRKRELTKQYMKQVVRRDKIDEAIAIRQKIINQAKGEILRLQKERKNVESEIAITSETLKSFE